MKNTLLILIFIVLVFLSAISFGFFYQSQRSGDAVANYKTQLAEIRTVLNDVMKMNRDLTKLKIGLEKENKSLRGELTKTPVIRNNYDSQILKKTNKELEEENKTLRDTLIQLKSELFELRMDSGVFEPIADKIKSIAAMVDNLDVTPRQRTQMIELLQAINKELGSLSISIERLLQDKSKLVEKSKFKETVYDGKKIDEIIRENIDLSQKISRNEKLIKGLNERIYWLERENGKIASNHQEKEKNIQAVNNQITTLKKDNDALVLKIEQYKTEMAKLNEKILVLAKDNQDFLAQKNSSDKLAMAKSEEAKALSNQAAITAGEYRNLTFQYNQLKKKTEDLEAEMTKRADKIVNLQTALEEKNSSMLEVTLKMQEQLKELVKMRESALSARMENNKLSSQLKTREDSLNSLKTEVSRINEINNQLKDYVDRVSSLAASSGQIKSYGDNVALQSSGKESNKDVKVEIESIQVNENDVSSVTEAKNTTDSR